MALPTRVFRGHLVDPFETAQREFDTLVNRFLGGREMGNGTVLAPYPVDIREDGDHLRVEAELPGFSKDQIDVTIENQTLTITAERTEQPGDKNGGDYLLRERRYARFQRSFTLPPTVDEASVNAKYADGVLTITLSKREETKPRKIAVA